MPVKASLLRGRNVRRAKSRSACIVIDAVDAHRQVEKELRYQREVERALRRESRMRAAAERVVRKQSQALSNTLNLLLREPEHADFVRAILRAITRECEGLWATFWEIDRAKEPASRAISFYCDLEIEGAVEGFTAGHPREVARLARLYLALLKDHRCTIVLAADDPRVPRAIRSFYEVLQVRSMLLTPLLVSNELLGWICHLSKEAANRIHPDKVAFLEATGKQTILATHLKSLGEAARVSERARERERAAIEKEAELNRIGRLLRVPLIEASGELEGIDALLKGVLQNMVGLLEGESASLWKRDGDPDAHAPILLWRDGRPFLLPPDESRELGLLARTNHHALLKLWSGADDILIEKSSSPRMRRFLGEASPHREALSGSHIVTIPLSFNDEAPGFVLISTSRIPRRADERCLAVKALALQAALALRLHRLSKAQRRAALAGERNRIARDMHDLLAQAFSGIALQIEAMRAECPDLPAAVTERLEKIRDHAGRSVDAVRRSIQMLRPALLDNHTLADALVSLGREMEMACGIPIKVSTGRGVPPLDSKLEIHLFSIASEAMRNATRHACSRRITVSLRNIRGRLSMVVQDDGLGFEGSTIRGGKPAHFGLANMRERARDIGGSLTVRSRPGSGTRVEVAVPLNG
ncbi:MAG: sensor histidine kinase [Terrimicrobiaceae bacterium]|nr:sensor histidine kinase [Terrimicrobiaceae bacterium]